jgi:hypothetical protein
VAIGALKQVATAQLIHGKSVTLDDGTKITFDGYSQWATIQVNHDPGQTLVLWAAGAVVLGLLLSLAVRRRRLFLRITPRPAPIRKLWTTRRLWTTARARTATPVVWSRSGGWPAPTPAASARSSPASSSGSATLRPSGRTSRARQRRTRDAVRPHVHVVDHPVQPRPRRLLRGVRVRPARQVASTSPEQVLVATGAAAGPGAPAVKSVSAPPKRPRVRAPQAERFGRVAVAATVLGLAVQLTSLTLRGIATHRVPWGNMYEFASWSPPPR